ncbi:UDP-N-acetylmuramate--L-alanine ligase [Candidatus Vallotia tarda]|uniref:UDP-N-acetylmuramate--L-alanine ligase n=1 Tax=Candidatus Vallotiella hemipterorum TaxID=1177213 RepID=A0A916NUP5_9BURK|nr:UDP-N-acetylmuramate--L-alanine ligase [Candidatus Vallotia tarda]CAG7599309.1 UDP-N-acetylmuramate--L-alanine ligase [Candidatus Vallotia tarda]
MKHTIKHIHFVGIGGAGMGGIAEVLLNLGYRVSGSDISRSAITERLIGLGADIKLGHNAKYINGADAVVISTAVCSNNPEVLEARRRRIPIVPRAVMLAELMRLKQGIAVAGTHGKTTTTSLIASILVAGGLDPTFVIGGHLISAGTNARLGTGDLIVAEADESDASFLNLLPVIEVITNIDTDHMDAYGHDFARLKQAFITFTYRLPFYGIAVLCVDDPNVREILPFVSRPIIRYGFSQEADVRATKVLAKEGQMHFTVHRVDAPSLDILLNLPGTHNVQNALAAIAIATELEVDDIDIQSALAKFKGVSRRFQCYGEIELTHGGTYLLIDDYGHHPVEMAATIAAARGAFPARRLILVFQLHRYTRTRDCFEDFVRVLSTVDALVLTEVYAAGEMPIVAADGSALARAIHLAGWIEPVFVDSINKIPDVLAKVVADGDIVLTMGAGSISVIPCQLIGKQRV